MLARHEAGAALRGADGRDGAGVEGQGVGFDAVEPAPVVTRTPLDDCSSERPRQLRPSAR